MAALIFKFDDGLTGISLARNAVGFGVGNLSV